MLRKDKCDLVLEKLEEMFPNASCELIYHNIFELLIAVVLSAQTTDKAVNIVTKDLFDKYPDAYKLSEASFSDVKSIISRIGLSQNKSKNIIALSKVLVEKYDGNVPDDFDKLIQLPGVGRKTANVVLSEGFHIMRIAVDTHVDRVSKRLGLADENASVLEVEKSLCSLIQKEKWHHSHHLLLFFGRYFCKSKNPNCKDCFNKKDCKYNDFKNDKNLQE